MARRPYLHTGGAAQARQEELLETIAGGGEAGAGIGAIGNTTDTKAVDSDATASLIAVAKALLDGVYLKDPSSGARVQYPSAGWVFDVPVVPTVTNGAYSAGDIMGGLMTLAAVAPANDAGLIITGAQVSIKAAVMPNPLSLVIFNADPSGTTTTDNAAYSLAAADAFKVVCTIPFQTLGVTHFDHGTPNTIRIDNLFIPCLPISGTDDLKAILVDGSGVTLTSTGDIQLRVRGIGG